MGFSCVGVCLIVFSFISITRGQLDETVIDGNVIFVNEVQVPEVWQIFNSSTQTVEEGAPLNLKCGIHGNYDSCEWQGPGGIIYDVYEQVYRGLVVGVKKPSQQHGNECGIVIETAGTQHRGQWTCIISGRRLLSRSKEVKVLVKTPPPPGAEKCSSIAVNSGYCVPFTSCYDKLDEPLKFLTISQFVEAYGCGRDSSGVTMVCCPE